MACLLGMLGIGLGMPYEDLPGDDDVGDFLDNILTNQGEAILDKFVSALTEHKAGLLSHDEALLAVVQLLKSRPHLLCGLSMWIPAERVRSSDTPAFNELRGGIADTLGRSHGAGQQLIIA